MGSNAMYIRDVLEPVMQEHDIEGFEEYLNRTEPGRSFRKRFHFTSITTRWLFPTLQLILLAYGVWGYFKDGTPNQGALTLVILTGIIGLAIVGLTLWKVKHIRR